MRKLSAKKGAVKRHHLPVVMQRMTPAARTRHLAKLWVQRLSDKQAVFNWDRGMDMPAADQAAAAVEEHKKAEAEGRETCQAPQEGADHWTSPAA